MNNKFAMILGAVVIVCLIAFGAMFFMMWSKINEMNVKAATADGQKGEEAVVARKMGPIYSMPSFIVNLDDPKLRKYLRLTMDMEITDDKTLVEFEGKLPQIRDAVLTILPSNRYEEITTVAGKNALRTELLAAANSFFGKETVVNIYFTEFVIQ
jgi:flagellar FliL protein